VVTRRGNKGRPATSCAATLRGLRYNARRNDIDAA
jgi:hypothetical protein